MMENAPVPMVGSAAAPGISGAGSGGEGGGGGAPGGFEDVVHGLSNHSATPWTITSGGTTWLNTTDTGEVGTDWTLWPWEFPSLFMSNNERIDLYNDYLFWRCKSVTVNFKNFRGYVNTVSSSETLPNTFPTDNAAFMTYLDEMYFMGIQVSPFANENGWIDEGGLLNIVQSWQKGGYNGNSSDTTGRVSLPVFDIAVNEQVENYISQNTPNVSQTQAIAGQRKTHTWHTVGDKYWRDTSEFLQGFPSRFVTPEEAPPNGDSQAWLGSVNRPFRADQFGGLILSGGTAGRAAAFGDTNLTYHSMNPGLVPNVALFNSPYGFTSSYSRERAIGLHNEGYATETGSPAVVLQAYSRPLTQHAGIPPVVYTTHEPIPPLLLRIVPQHIEGNGNSTHIQFDFDITYNIEVRCKIPRHGYTNVGDFSQPAGFAQQPGIGSIATKNRPGTATPVLAYYPGTLPVADFEVVAGPEFQGIQRGRTKNGFCFIPYGGWENSLRTYTQSPNAVPPPPIAIKKKKTDGEAPFKKHKL